MERELLCDSRGLGCDNIVGWNEKCGFFNLTI